MKPYTVEILNDGRGKVKNSAGAVVATTYVVDGEDAAKMANLIAAALNARPDNTDAEVDE